MNLNMNEELSSQLEHSGYEVDDILGVNDISEVYKLKNVKTEESLVLKVVKGINTPLYNVIFEREVGALNKIRTCSNIVRFLRQEILELKNGEHYGLVYLEYINGKSLKHIDVIDELSSKKDLYLVIKQIIEAIETAHTYGIIHRDINPGNIIISDSKQVKLIDFGISKIKGMVNSDTVYQFATNRFAAPELRYHEENATEQSDLYSLGAVIYFLHTGEYPPVPEDFEEELETSRGIAVELKEIIRNLIKFSQSNRYKDIYEVKKDFFALYNQINKSNRMYLFYIDTQKLQHLKNVNLVQDKSYTDLVNIDLKNEFLDSYIFIEKENTEDELYQLYGNHISFDCIYDSNREIFQIVHGKKLNASYRDKIKNTYFEINGKVKFIYKNQYIEPNNNFELTVETKSNKMEYLSSANVNDKYKENFSAWHTFLDIQEEYIKDNVPRIKYNSFSEKDNLIIFEIEPQAFFDIDVDENEEMKFVFEEKNFKGKLREIGVLDSHYTEDNKYYLQLKKTGTITLPMNGYISKDYYRKLSLVKRESKAIYAFNNEQYECSSNLKSIFSGIEKATYLEGMKDLVFFTKTLDPSQKSAVKKALNSQDIALIQGPPGTGKTNVIVEIVRQILKTNPRGGVCKQRILIVSQAHAAVNKMLEDLDDATNSVCKILKIGREINFTSRIKKYSIDSSKKKWIDDVLKNSNSFAIKKLEHLNISKSDFDNYCKCKNECNCKNESECEVLIDKSNCSCNSKKNDSFKMQFERKYNNIIEQNKKDFNALLIQNLWAKGINIKEDIEQYFIKDAEIIAGTCTGVVANPVINDISFDYVIIDEAAKATYPELLIPINKAKKVVIVGDHKQLPPILEEELIKRSQDKFKELNVDSNKLYENIFQKIHEYLPKENVQQLNTQYRMHPTIGTMVSNIFYDGEINNGIDISDRKHSIVPYKDLAIVWIDTSNCKSNTDEPVGTSQKNVLESEIVKDQLKLINQHIGDSDQNVGVITPYKAQKELIRRTIQQTEFVNIKDEITVNSVDAFQGSQKDIIIYSTVKTRKSITFLKSEERLNVAFSRAKRLLIIIGSINFLLKDQLSDNKFPDIVDYIRENNKTCKIIDYNEILLAKEVNQ